MVFHIIHLQPILFSYNSEPTLFSSDIRGFTLKHLDVPMFTFYVHRDSNTNDNVNSTRNKFMF